MPDEVARAAAIASPTTPVSLPTATISPPRVAFTDGWAYFSTLYENLATGDVTIPPGATNSFAPDPGDRMQPTRFKPGHWRFQCVMVVGPEFDGKMRWTLSYAGTTTGTSERMLQSNWNLVEGASELAKIET